MASSYADYVHHGVTNDDDTPTEDRTSQWVETWFATEIGSSQLLGAPFDPTQATQEAEATPSAMVTGCLTRQIVPPDPLTYLQHQTRAARAAERRGRRAVGAAQRHKRGHI